MIAPVGTVAVIADMSHIDSQIGIVSNPRLPDISYPNLFVPRLFVPQERARLALNLTLTLAVTRNSNTST